jgi:mandelate racemase
MQPTALTLKSVRVRQVLLPRRYVPNSSGWPVILVDLFTSEGVVGHSYLQPYVKTAYRYIAPMIEDLVEAMKGKAASPHDVFRNGRAMLAPIGLEGAAMAAVSALDMALWDAVAKQAGLPLVQLLGGTSGPVRAYSSNGLYLKNPDELASEAAVLRDEGGFSALKLRLGRKSLAADLKAIDAVRRTCGDALLLMADFSQLYGMDEALTRCRILDDQGLYWFEEPIVYDNYPAMAELRRRLKTPIQIGENFWGPRQMELALQMGATDFVMPDLMRIGGVTGWLSAASIAAAKGVPVSTHLYPEFCAHLMRVTETAHWLEWANFANPVIAEPFEIKEGNVLIPDRPGSGIEWDEYAVARYAC